MRICLVTHGFPPEERTGVETYTEALALELCREGHRVEVFTPRPDAAQADLALRRELRREGFGVTRIATNQPPRDPVEVLDPPGVAARFGEWLDRERPEVVHFQHVIKLGLGLVEEARTRGIPVLFTAHDYYGLCHRYTLLRPDLGVCPDPRAAGACARCDLATAVLNRVEGLGDYQIGVRPGGLEAGARAALEGTLDGDPVADGGFDPGEWQAARERREQLDARRLRVFQSFDLRLAPSRFLARQLERAGVGPVELQPYGIVAEDLERLSERAPVGAKGPLRLAFIGGLSKHKGIDVLLDAFELLEAQAPGAAELAIHGYSSDAVFVDQLRTRAGAVGATWHGAYARAELPAVLAAADVVVVPSTWYENYPIAIREAFAAGRPVVTSRLGALGESVEDGVDGLLFAPGDARDLARVLAELLVPGRVAELAAGIGPVRTMAEDARELVGRYQDLIDKAAESRAAALSAELPASMREFVGRLEELEREPLRELFVGVSRGLGRLGRGLGLDGTELAADRLFAEAFAEEDEAQRRLRDTRREVEWLRGALEARELAEGSQTERLEWAERTLADRDATIASLEGQVGELARARDAHQEKAAWLEGNLAGEQRTIEALNEQCEHLKQVIEERDRALEDRDRALHDRDELLGEKARQLHLAGQREAELIAGLEAERRERELREGQLEQRLHQVAEVGLLALERQEHAMVRGLMPLFEAIDRASGQGREGPSQPLQSGLDELVEAVRQGLEGLGQLELELAWRRDEMRAAQLEALRPLVHQLIKRMGLGKRVSSWESTS